MKLPRFIVLRIHNALCVRYVSPREVLWGSDEDLFNIFVKIEVEAAKNNDDYFHLRFSHSNKYWARGQGADSGLLVANSSKPEEDTSNPSCTLFYLQPKAGKDKAFYFKHVQSGGRVRPVGITSPISVYNGESFSDVAFNMVNYDTLVKLPRFVAFKGDNDKYLKAITKEGHPYLQFSSDDPNAIECGHEVMLMSNQGYIKIKSLHFLKLWRRSPNWIWCDGSLPRVGTLDNPDFYFWPMKIDEKTIALRARLNNNFCKRLTTEGKTHCLNAAVSTITKEARLEVEELVMNRKIYGVKYRMEDARIYNANPYLAGTTTAINTGNEEGSIAVEIEYQDSRSYSFSRSVSITAGMSITLEADVLSIVKGSIKSAFSVSGGFKWNDTNTATKTVKATGTVRVPARTTAVVRYVGSVGTCDVPFTYKQQDKSSSYGTIVTTDEVDGIFTGVNYYDFDFEFAEMRAL